MRHVRQLRRLAGMGLILVALAGPVSCGDHASDLSGPNAPSGPRSPRTGTLQVSTSTEGEHFDQDGYLVTIDDVDTLHLNPGATIEVELAPGRHSLKLLGLADNCWVFSGTVEINVSAGRTAPVSWSVFCRAPTTSGDLAYESAGDIYLAGLDGSTLRRLTSDGSASSYNTEPAWSPDGRRIVFSTFDGQWGAGIYVIDLDRGSPRRLSPAGAYDATPTWSPDGSRIAFENRADNQSGGQIFVMNADGTKRVQLTTNRQPTFSPAWSPKGHRIAYVTYDESAPGEGTHIYVMKPDGTNNVRLTTGAGEDTDPAWSPDGDRIAFIRSGNLTVMNADGTNHRPLTLTRDAANPAWSPNGSMIAIDRFTDCKETPYGDEDCHIAIWLVQLPGGQMRELPLAGWLPSSPSWRP